MRVVARAGVVGMIVGALALPAAAAADVTYCVSKPSCAGTSKTTIADAITAANGDGQPSRIEIGSGSFASPGATFANQPVTIVGSGVDQTTLLPAANSSLFVQTGSLVSDMTIQADGTSGHEALRLLGAEAERIAAVDPGSGDSTGVVLFNGGYLHDSRVVMNSTGDSEGIAVAGSDASKHPRVERTTVEGGSGIRAVTAADTVISQVSVKAHSGFSQTGLSGTPATTIHDSVFRLVDRPSVADCAISQAANSSSNVLHVYGSSIDAGAAVSDTSICQASAQAARSVGMDVHSSVMRGGGSDVRRSAGSAAATANLSLEYSYFSPSRVSSTNLGSGAGSVTQGAGNVNSAGVDARFASAPKSDFDLQFGSPLIDAGDPGAVPDEPATDVMGRPRVVDSDSVSGARRDIGAYEYQAGAPSVSAAATPPSPQQGIAVSFTATGSDPDAGDALTYAWSFDDGGTGSGASVSHAFGTPGPHSGTVTVTDTTHRSATATATVTILAPGGGDPDQACAIKLSGTAKADRLNGTAGGDTLLGGKGNDVLSGLGGNDCLDGGAGNDKLDGGTGADLLKGGVGNDRLVGGTGSDAMVGGSGKDRLTGGSGSDRLAGGSGNDQLTGGAGQDRLEGGSGNDTINSRDGKKETVDCGRGRDRVTADKEDKLKGCERVRRR